MASKVAPSTLKKVKAIPLSDFSKIQCAMKATFSGCSRTVGATAWASASSEEQQQSPSPSYLSNLVAYAGRKSVFIYDFDRQQNVAVLNGHSDKVNCVQWIPNTKFFTHFPHGKDQLLKQDWRGVALNPPFELLSASTDGSIIHWRRISDHDSWEKVHVLRTSSKASVTSISCIAMPDKSLLLAAASADYLVKVWNLGDEKKEWTLVQDLTFAPKIIEAVCLFLFPEPNTAPTPMLAIAGTDLLITLFIFVKGKFCKLLSLSGHEDWIRTLSAVQTDEKEILIASASQDTRIRVWKIARENSSTKNVREPSSHDDPDLFLDKGHFFKFNQTVFHVFLESVLLGHEDWVLSAAWHPVQLNKAKTGFSQQVSLLSASMDRSMMIWKPDSQHGGVWSNEVHVGEVGGNTLGFFGGIFNPVNAQEILANGYNGAFHLWKEASRQKGEKRENNKDNDNKKNSNNDHDDEQQGASGNVPLWSAAFAMSGDFGPVVDCCWHPQGYYFATVSEDQTTRIFAPWNQEKNNNTTGEGSWHEISRAQVHGYDLTTIAFVPNKGHCFVSGAQEKVIRVFTAPSTFLETINNISRLSLASEEGMIGANVPTLGLSNKPVLQEESQKQKDTSRFEFKDPPKPIVHQQPPVEEHLFESTLWPEIHKLYGHPNEIVAVTANHRGSLVASSCRATKTDQATIRIWDTNSWKEVAQLQAHTLTVVQMEFSHDDRYLLAVSRDRDFSVWDMNQMEIVQLASKAHERIIWSGSWSSDDKIIATGSRDKTIRLWKREEALWTCFQTLDFPEPVTAVAFLNAPTAFVQSHILAFGLENGAVGIVKQLKENAFQFLAPSLISERFWHADSVAKIQWRPCAESPAFVSVSHDHSTRLFEVQKEHLSNQ